MADLELILHRGGVEYHPENSLNAILTAWAMGASAEIDIHLSSDLVPFLLHDDTLARTVNVLPKYKRTNVRELTYETIQQYHLHCGDQNRCPPPKFETIIELLSVNSDRKLTLDVKDPDAYPIIFKLIKKYGAENQIFFTAPLLEPLAKCKKALPKALTSLWVSNLSTKEDSMFMQGINSSVVDSITYIHFGRVQPNATFESDETIQKALELTREHKALTLAIYSDSWKPGKMQTLYDLGLRRIIVDRSLEFYNEFTRSK